MGHCSNNIDNKNDKFIIGNFDFFSIFFSLLPILMQASVQAILYRNYGSDGGVVNGSLSTNRMVSVRIPLLASNPTFGIESHFLFRSF
jgi:hypothetical protein